MWLLDLNDLNDIRLKFFNEKNTPRYAILSHTWLEDNDQELSFYDLRDGLQRNNNGSKQGYGKVLQCCYMAHKDGLRYCWIDTCCINKDSSAELSEAINSMFIWYQEAVVCYAYLVDIEYRYQPNDFTQSRWFTRGWTLQELLAPADVKFFDHEWHYITSKHVQCDQISHVTGIDPAYLKRERSIDKASVAARMSWAAGRETTRTEDIAYCLLGIFGINMTLLYGERDRAFIRLQEEIMRETDDQSLFAWEADWENAQSSGEGMLAKSPKDFAGSMHVEPLRGSSNEEPASVTAKGLKIRMPFTRVHDHIVGILRCTNGPNSLGIVGIVLASRSGSLENLEQLRRKRDSRLQLIPWQTFSLLDQDLFTVFVAKASSISEADDMDDHVHSFEVRSSPGTSITAWWPPGCHLADVGENIIHLQTLRSKQESRHAIVVVADSRGELACVAFGFGSLLGCGIADTAKYWAAVPSYDAGSNIVPPGFRKRSIRNSNDSRWLELQWQDYRSSALQEDTTSKPLVVLRGDKRIAVYMRRRADIGGVIHAVDIIFETVG